MNQLVAYLYYIVISKSTFIFLHFFWLRGQKLIEYLYVMS